LVAVFHLRTGRKIQTEGNPDMYAFIITLFFFALSGSAFAEVVSTTDGRKLELSVDGTYRVLESELTVEILLTELKPYFEPFKGEYDQNSMRFMPIFQNETGKIVVGFKFLTVFQSAFGDEVFSFDGESSEKIAAGKSSTADTFYFFEDNQFISGEPFDKLQIFQASGTGKISSTVTAVVFEDGTVAKRTLK
jgi:hypothetical protein